MKTSTKTLLLVLAVSGTFFSCSNEDDIIVGPRQQLSFIATSSDGAQKSSVSGRKETRLVTGNNVHFAISDAISVFDAGKTNNNFVTSEDGESVRFYGTAAESANYVALYPYQAAASYDGTSLTCDIPATQYAQSGLTYDPKAALSVAYTSSEDMTFYFKNVTSMVKFTLAVPAAKVVFKGNNNEVVAGGISVTGISASSDPSVTAAGGNATKEITLLPGTGATKIPAGTYYINVIPQSFSKGFTLDVYMTANVKGFYHLVPTSTTLTRSRIRNIGSVDFPTPTGPEYVEIGGKKWATKNLDATTIAGNPANCYGDYYAWGETVPCYYYTSKQWVWSESSWGESGWSIAAWRKAGGYCWQSYCGQTSFTEWTTKPYDATTGVLKPAYDAVQQRKGNGWRMPTTNDFAALRNACTGGTGTAYSVINVLATSNPTGGVYWLAFGQTYLPEYSSVAGVLFVDKADPSKRLFFPAAGNFNGKSFANSGLNGFYGSSSLLMTSPQNTLPLLLCMTDLNMTYGNFRFYGFPVRPVKD